MRGLFSLCLLCIISVNSLAQSKAEIKKQKELNDTLKKKLSGVKFADLSLSKAHEQLVLNNPTTPEAQVLIGFVDYLKKDLGLQVIVTQEDRIEALKIAKSKCDLVHFNFDVGQFKGRVLFIGSTPFSFSFSFCDKSEYSFKSRLVVDALAVRLSRKLINIRTREACLYYFSCKRKFDINEKMLIQKNPSLISLADFTKYLDSSLHKLPIEGVYQLDSSSNNTSKHKIGIYNIMDTLKIIYFDGADFSEDWVEGEIKGYLIKTNSDSHFFAKWNTLNKTLIDAALTLVNNNSLELKSSDIYYPMDDKYVRIK